MWTSSALSISSSMPVILPARSGNMRWMRGNSLSPSICFCSWGGGSGKHRGGQRLLALDEHCLLRRRSSTWCHHLSRHHLGWRVASSWRVLEALLRTHLGSNHRHWWHAWPGHHGHWLRS